MRERFCVVWTKVVDESALKKSKNTWNKHPCFGFIFVIIIITSKTPHS
jgi:hypothetical protein